MVYLQYSPVSCVI